MSADFETRSSSRRAAGGPWAVVGMLWCVCFLNYADRQAIFSVFPLIKTQLQLSDVQLGIIGASFMWVYALAGPFAGWLSDRLPRNRVVLCALLFWSAVTAATAISHSYPQLVVLRALGGLGEAFYFPAAMSLIGDYHATATRSRAMSLHQSSVYVGSVAGGAFSALIAEREGWRASFVVFGLAGVALALVLWRQLREPVRSEPGGGSPRAGSAAPLAASRLDLLGSLAELLRNRMVLLLIAVFMGANFVAVVFLTWLPTFLFRKFHMSLSLAGFNGTAFLQAASILGVLAGGLLADAAAHRRRGGRLLIQAVGLLCGAPFLVLTGWTAAVPLLIVGMIGFGLAKGMYDANIFASLYDVIPESRRGVAAGLLNSMGWVGGGFAPIVIALASARYGMSACLSATAAIYLMLGVGLLWGSARLSRPA